MALRNDLIGDGYSTAVEMMDSEDALRGRRSGLLDWFIILSFVDVLQVSGVR